MTRSTIVSTRAKKPSTTKQKSSTTKNKKGSAFVTRAYNSLHLDETRGIVTKVSEADRLKDEMYYYRALPRELAVFFPRVHDAYSKDGRHVLELEYYAYSDVGRLMVEKDFTSNKELWRKLFQRLKHILATFAQHKKPSKQKYFDDMFVKKTLTEYEKLKNNFPEFKTICDTDTLIINGKVYKNFEGIWPQLEPMVRKLFASSFTAFHGDFCFGNILYGIGHNDSVVVKLIDPRGRFGAPGYWGDYRYDFAKLLHSFDGGYEYIVRDTFTLDHRDNQINFTFTNDSRQAIKKLFHEVFADSTFFLKHKGECALIHGLIFIGMCARHYDSLERQKIMYATGVRILNDYLNKKY